MSKDEHEIDIGDRRAAANVGIPFRQALVVFGVFYVVAALLNGRAIHEEATRREYGPVRTAWVAATAPLNTVATRTGVDRFRRIFEGWLEDEP